jgi:hypothetical protein
VKSCFRCHGIMSAVLGTAIKPQLFADGGLTPCQPGKTGGCSRGDIPRCCRRSFRACREFAPSCPCFQSECGNVRNRPLGCSPGLTKPRSCLI